MMETRKTLMPLTDLVAPVTVINMCLLILCCFQFLLLKLLHKFTLYIYISAIHTVKIK